MTISSFISLCLGKGVKHTVITNVKEKPAQEADEKKKKNKRTFGVFKDSKSASPYVPPPKKQKTDAAASASKAAPN